MSVRFITPAPHFCIYSKTGVYRGIHFFLVLFYNIDREYLLEPPQINSIETLVITVIQCFIFSP